MLHTMLRKRVHIPFVLAMSVALLSGCGDGYANSPAAPERRPRPVLVAAAASLTDAMDQLREPIRDRLGIDMTVHTASSGTLARQILMGAPVDLFISANVRWMDKLEQNGLIAADSRIKLLRNRLVVIAAPDVEFSPETVSDLAHGPSPLAIGDPSYVPAGRYAKQALRNAGVWSALESDVLPAVDVRAALNYVETGAAPLGIVYATGAAAAVRARPVLRIPSDLHTPIVYPAAIIKNADHPGAAAAVLRFLRSEAAERVFEHAGFEVVGKHHGATGD